MVAGDRDRAAGSEGDYVLGTHDAEAERLGLQHRVWRDAAHAAWARAGVTAGSRVIDVGAGPGHATLDLASIVGPEGAVLAIERSPRYAERLRETCRARSLSQVTVIEADLMAPPAVDAHDVAWCRWVACFVPAPERLVGWIAESLRPGGVAVFHEYSTYATWRYLPRRPALEEFVAAVMQSWRADGGEPDIAAPLAGHLQAAGFEVTEVRPHIHAASPGQPFWRWPAAFVGTNLARLVELGRADRAWADRIEAELAAAEADPSSRVLTPLVAEVIARKR